MISIFAGDWEEALYIPSFPSSATAEDRRKNIIVSARDVGR